MNPQRLIETLKMLKDSLIIEVEITETESLNINEILKAINQITSMGFKLVIDDFGKGYSSFDRLKNLDVCGVKIDRSLIVDLLENEKTYRFIKNLVSFLKNMNYKVTVEGVEEEKIVNALAEIGVDEIQGYYFSKPVREERFLECLKNWEKLQKCEE